MCQKTWHSSPFRSGDVTIVSRISGSHAARHTHEPQQAMVDANSGWSATFVTVSPRA